MGIFDWFKRRLAATPTRQAAPGRESVVSRVADVPGHDPVTRPSPPTWPAVFGSPFVGADGELQSMTPTCDVLVQGVPCAKGAFTTFHRESGRLQTTTLAREWSCDGEPLMAGTPIVLGRDGRLEGWSARLATARTFLIRAAGGDALDHPFEVPAGSDVEVEYGQLRTVVLGAEATIDGWRLPADTEVIFGDSGAISHVSPGEPLELRGLTWAEHETIVFEFGVLREGYLDGEQVVDGLPCAEFELVRFDDDGQLVRFVPATDIDVKGVPVAAGSRVVLHGNGAVFEAVLAERWTSGAVTVAAGETVVVGEDSQLLMGAPVEPFDVMGLRGAARVRQLFHDDGHPLQLTLGADASVAGVVVREGGRVAWAASSGSVAWIDGVDLERGEERFEGHWTLYLDADGGLRLALPTVPQTSRIRGCHLRRDATIGPVRAIAGSEVAFHEDGSLASAVLAEDQGVVGLPAKARTLVRWDESGSVVELTLAREHAIHGVPCAAGRALAHTQNDVLDVWYESVQLHASGRVRRATLAGPYTHSRMSLARGSVVVFHPNGVLEVGTLAAAFESTDGWTAAGGSLIGCFADGSPSLVTLAADGVVAGTSYPAGHFVKLSAPGVIDSATASRVAIDAEPLGAPVV